MKRDVMRAIRAYCMECCCEQTGEIKDCLSTKCPLYPYRMGKDEAARRSNRSSNKPGYDEHTFDFMKKVE